VLQLNTEGEFQKLIQDARREARDAMANDDVAVVVLTFGRPHSQYLESMYVAAPRREPAASEAPPSVEPAIAGRFVLETQQTPQGADFSASSPRDGPSTDFSE